MKKIYSFVLMAMMLLIGTQTWAAGATLVYNDVSSKAALYEAWQAGDATDTVIIKLTSDITIDKELWLGAQSEGGTFTRSITLDLNGKVLNTDPNVTTANKYMRNMFVLSRGELNIISSQGTGLIKSNHGRKVVNSSAGHQELIRISGTNSTDYVTDKVKGETGYTGYFTHLTIGKNVTVSADSVTAITVDAINASWPFLNGTSESTLMSNVTSRVLLPLATMTASDENNYKCPYSTRKSASCGVPASGYSEDRANGVRVDIEGAVFGKKYAMKVNGYVAYIDKNDELKSAPYIHLHPTADLSVPANSTDDKKPVVAYCSGYAHWLIEGKCVGATAIYVKGGDVKIKDAIIESNYTGNYTAPTATSQGVTGMGSAITVESNNNYAGNIDVVISGDTKVTAKNGYAIEEDVTNANKTNVQTISITGGTFEGGNVGTQENPQQGTIHISTETVANDGSKVEVVGGKVNGDANLGDQTLEQFLAGQTETQTHVTYVTTEDNKTVMVISEGAAPTPKTTWGDAVTYYNDPEQQWTADKRPSIKIEEEFGQITPVELPADWDLAELELNVDEYQTLTIPANKTLKVGRVVLGKKAQIIVNAGGKFIVTGAQGIVAPVVSNIVLKSSETSQAIFLFNPAVTSNKHPNGTVEFISKGYKKSGSEFGWQKFGVPTQTLKEISIEDNYATVFAKFNYEAATPAWEVIGYLNHPTAQPTLDLDDLNQAFEYYQMEHGNASIGTKVTFKGELVGNDCPAPAIRANFWNGYANSYSAPIDGKALLAQIPAPADKAYYLYEMDVLTEKFSWVAQSMLQSHDINPMQPFLVRNPNANETALALNYKAAVYDPATTTSNAPARRNDMTKVEFIVRGENGVDHVIVAQDDQFSAEFDNGYDVAKYMNDDVNMYVSAEEKMAIYATDNLENTYIGIQTVSGGNYTIEFAEVQGEELTLIDHETNACVAMVAGSKYEFTTTANSVNDYRFEIVASSEVPTSIENTEAVKSAKGIYTITGQYVGEMNVWNTLPAGVYVVNGEKRVK